MVRKARGQARTARHTRGRNAVLSFVIPAHNEARYLRPTLQSIHDACSDLDERYEILVVDDASTDATADIAREHGARVVAVEHRHIAATRNSGARAARGHSLLFVDADTCVDRGVIGAMKTALDAGVVGGGAAVRFDAEAPRWGAIAMDVVIFGFRRLGLAAGCFLFCTRGAYEAVGGFDERFFGGEEIAMSAALKRRGRFVVLREPVVTSSRKLRARSFWDMAAFVGALLLRPGRVRSRRGLDYWYGDSR